MKRYHSYLTVISVFVCLSLVKAETKSIILGRPTDTSVTASVLFDKNVEFFLEYGTESGMYTGTTTILTNKAGTPDEVDIHPLIPNTRYYYRLRYRSVGAGSYDASQEYSFHTQRAQGESFKFLIEADEHLYDKKGVRSLYKICLENQAKDSADFMISLGDTFGDDHTPDQTTSADMDALHKDYLQYLGEVCHSMPFFFCLGNHEGENGYYLKQTPPNNIGVYGTQWRKFYYPNPYPNGFYSGNTKEELFGMGLPENYYTWTWGDALFVVLDVYRHCDVNEKPQNWDWTLGDEQYKWLKTTLEASSAKYKFVFAHHNRGQGRGAVKVAKGFEWGGYDNNQYKFDIFRPGWAMPIHQLMVANGVNIFFQGHDHLYAKEELDGLVYQEVPMPSDSTYEIGLLANADAYTDVTLDGSGHIRVTVEPEKVTVDYIRAYLPADTVDGEHHNGEVAYSYSVGKSTSVSGSDLKSEPEVIAVSQNESRNSLIVRSKNISLVERKVELINLHGQTVKTEVWPRGNTVCHINIDNTPTGVYMVKLLSDSRTTHVEKVVVFK